MADDATVNITATILPDEIAKTISGTMTISPADANDKWYYKLTSVSNSSTDLMAGNLKAVLATLELRDLVVNNSSFEFLGKNYAAAELYANEYQIKLNDYSINTVKQFYSDGKKSRFKI